jgi:cytosolic iron-sulfur protein assembly protein CIAO1
MLSLVSTLEGHDDRIWCVAWNPKGTMLASSSTDKTVKIWSYNIETNECKCVETLTDGHTRTIRWVSWSPCGTKLATASFDSSITIWKKKHFDNTFEIVANLEGHENEVKCVAWSSDGDFLASCSRDKSVWIWDVCEDDEYECSAVMTTHSQDVKHIAWMPMKNVI